MRIAIIGCGAMGSIYAGLLASAGNEILAVHRNAAHVEHMMTHGLRVEGMSGDRIVAIRASVAVPRETVDLIILAVKATQAGEAAKSARPLYGKNTAVMTIQNGLGSADAVADALGETD